MLLYSDHTPQLEASISENPSLTAADIEAAYSGRWAVWLSDTGQWWAARTQPLTASQLAAGCVPFIRADAPVEIKQAISYEERLTNPNEDRDPVIVWLWDVSGPDRTACGVTGSQTRARQAAEAIITVDQATSAVLEQAVLGLGAGSMTYGYQRTGLAWHALLTDGRVTWTRPAARLAAS